MAKASKEAETTQEGAALAPVEKMDPTEFFSPNSLDSIMREYGITASDMTAPIPPTALKQNFEQLCSEKSEIVDEYGNTFAKVNGHTGPLMFLGKQGEYDGDKFTGYDGFYVYAIVHPTKGKTVVTMGRPEGEVRPAVVNYLDSLKPGQVFQVAEFATSKGFKVFNPVPVQRDGKLLK